MSQSAAVSLRGLSSGDKRETAQTDSQGPEIQAKWERMSNRSDNQDVGSEAAIIERVRNSSLVEWFGAENPTGLKPGTEASDQRFLREPRVVGERSTRSEGGP